MAIVPSQPTTAPPAGKLWRYDTINNSWKLVPITLTGSAVSGGSGVIPIQPSALSSTGEYIGSPKPTTGFFGPYGGTGTGTSKTSLPLGMPTSTSSIPITTAAVTPTATSASTTDTSTTDTSTTYASFLAYLKSLLGITGTQAGIDTPADYLESLGFGKGLVNYQQPTPDYGLLGVGQSPAGLRSISGTPVEDMDTSQLTGFDKLTKYTDAGTGTTVTTYPGWINPYFGNTGKGLYSGQGGNLQERMNAIYQPYFNPAQGYPNKTGKATNLQDMFADYADMMKSRYQQGASLVGWS